MNFNAIIEKVGLGRLLLALAMIAIIFLLPRVSGDAAENGWYDYGNGLINLRNTNFVNGTMRIALVPDTGEDWNVFNTRCGEIKPLAAEVSINENNVSDITGVASAGTASKCAWRANGAIKFDNFTLTLTEFSSEAGNTASQATSSYLETMAEVKSKL